MYCASLVLRLCVCHSLALALSLSLYPPLLRYYLELQAPDVLLGFASGLPLPVVEIGYNFAFYTMALTIGYAIFSNVQACLACRAMRHTHQPILYQLRLDTSLEWLIR